MKDGFRTHSYFLPTGKDNCFNQLKTNAPGAPPDSSPMTAPPFTWRYLLWGHLRWHLERKKEEIPGARSEQGRTIGWNREIGTGDPSSNQIPPTCPQKRVPKSLHEPRGLRLRTVLRGGLEARRALGVAAWPGDFTRWQQLQLS